MSGSVIPIPAGTLGFDCNQPVSANQARWFFNLGYRFVLRYVRRRGATRNDLSVREIFDLFNAGLGIMPVQHVEPQPWSPSESLGIEYGTSAARAAQEIGLPATVNVWLDLENVKRHHPTSEIILYCNAWHDVVSQHGFTPGIYVGWRNGLTASILYRRLKFKHYWSAYNLNSDEFPAVRGVQMRQKVAELRDIPKGLSFEIDKNVVTGDKLGGFPLCFAPDEWAVGGPRSGSSPGSTQVAR